jgi:hypothetical protein
MKSGPLGGQRTLRSKGSVGAIFPSPGRPKMKSGPLGGQRTLRSKGSVGAIFQLRHRSLHYLGIHTRTSDSSFSTSSGLAM